MAQRGIFKILSRKDGKGMITNDKDDEVIKVTKVLEFIPATKPQDVKEGKTIYRQYRRWIGLLAPKDEQI